MSREKQIKYPVTFDATLKNTELSQDELNEFIKYYKDGAKLKLSDEEKSFCQECKIVDIRINKFDFEINKFLVTVKLISKKS